MNRRIWTIIVHEYLTNIRRKEFILITIGLPLLILIVTGISALGTGSVISSLMQRRTERVGILDKGESLKLPPEAGDAAEAAIEPIKDEAAGLDLVRSGKMTAFIVVERDYVQSGKIRVYRKAGGLLNKGDTLPIGRILARSLLLKNGTDPRMAERAVRPMGEGSMTYLWNSNTGRFSARTGAGEAAKFLVPYAFTMLLFTSIFISASYLLRGIADEKENRVIEVILSSVTPEELLKGKLVGLAAVGLTQVGIWLGVAVIPAAAVFSQFVHISGATLAGLLLFFGLGFGLYATLMAGIGALGTSYRETQQISGGVSILAILPLLLITVILEFPNGTISRVLSFIPFTAPTAMVLRMSSAEVPVLDIVISALCVVGGIWLTLKLSSKLFRFGLLIYGKRPTMGETWRWLRQS